MEKKARRGPVKNRRSKAGETLTETLITMLIIGLSSVLFLTMVGASGRIFRKTEAEYDEIYEKIAAADVQSDTLSKDESSGLGKIAVKGESSTTQIAVDWYGSKDYVLSYKVR